jgi:hypothetical protein
LIEHLHLGHFSDSVGIAHLMHTFACGGGQKKAQGLILLVRRETSFSSDSSTIFGVSATGYPQCGHDVADVDMLLPHSGHETRAMQSLLSHDTIQL